ncbi:type II toxin-antitoxin system RelE/ParE family toxin [Aquimarina sp. SS2-1]|uniref:type II toxin-antitoxin system RelE/ParE family toxin n=1 Tax=Aquimarina besae TaxID=3342247 RepID=UPI00366D6609
MAKRIIWTSKADLIFTEILKFYCDRNKSKTYSRKLNQEINVIIKLLLKYPFLGIKTDTKDIRVIIKGHYKIFYQVESTEIIIHLVWDARQNPKKFTL